MASSIGFFSDAVIQSRGSGLGRLAREMISGVARWGHFSEVYAISAFGDASDPAHRRIKEELNMRFLPGPRKAWALAWSTLGAPAIDRFLPEVDLVHVVELNYPVPVKKPWVITLADIGPLSHPEFFAASHPWLMEKALEQAADRAAAIISISEATANDARAYLGRDLDITAIHLGVAEVFRKEPAPAVLEGIPDMPPAGTPFFFFVGSLNPRKNMLGILDAFEIAAERLPHRLVVTGEAGWDHSSTLDRFRDSPVSDRIHWIGHPEDEVVAALYGRAEALVFPSLFEGFGFPVVEAMSAGCPVITSNLSSMPEVAGDAAILADPRQPEEIAEAMVKIASETSTREEMVKKGREHAAGFTWERTVEKVVEVYRSIIG